MGKNKLAKFAEMETFTNVFQFPSTLLKQEQGMGMKNQWHDKVFGNNHPIVLELGCGKGEYTVELGMLFPDKNFIGVDIKGARMWTGAKKSNEMQLTNVAFLRTNIEMLSAFFGENEVSEIWLTFPDPQMKKVTKRLTATNFMQLYRRFLIPNGLIHLKTDSRFLFTYTNEMVNINRFRVVSCTDNLYSNNPTDPVLNIKTYYEQQWLGRGITIKYVCFELPQDISMTEPDIEIEHDSYRSFGRNTNSVLKNNL